MQSAKNHQQQDLRVLDPEALRNTSLEEQSCGNTVVNLPPIPAQAEGGEREDVEMSESVGVRAPDQQYEEALLGRDDNVNMANQDTVINIEPSVVIQEAGVGVRSPDEQR